MCNVAQSENNRYKDESEDACDKDHKIFVLVLVLENQTVNFAERTDVHPLPRHLVTAKLETVNADT